MHVLPRLYCPAATQAAGRCVGGWPRISTQIKALRLQAQKEGVGLFFLDAGKWETDRCMTVVKRDANRRTNDVSLLVCYLCRPRGCMMLLVVPIEMVVISSVLLMMSLTPGDQFTGSLWDIVYKGQVTPLVQNKVKVDVMVSETKDLQTL